MSEVIQAIFIRETEIRSVPKPHVVYKVEVHAAVRNWAVWKRYSEFYKLDSQFHSIFPKQPTPTKLPGKRYFPSTFSDPEKIEERRRGLEDYLRGILSSRDDRWRLTDVWREFLAIPSERTLDASAVYTSESWLDEYTTMVDTAREIRSLINKKSTHMARHEISASHNCTVQAKKLLMNLSSRLSNLEAGLTGLASITAEGELRRRQDMLTSLKDEKDTLMKLANSGRQPEQDLLYHPSHTQPTPTPYQPNHRAIAAANKYSDDRHGRAFGAAFQKQQQQKETEITRGLDNQGLLVHQQDLMKDQDQQVQQFSAILARQKQLGISIGHELETQNQVLDELDADVDRTQTKLKFASKKLQKIK
ncbi:Phox homologous domain-containing protein [Gilbertella persicaria]|uniref:Phox homologous domain-containing protein n=1 Tax=Gilbertella persicaria TaxID=101096 RepID=UPI00221F1DBD|nr:Phox homologous domain-containing protein [Gilbertella persicaria]KAI8087931.1 Phox homologous domain-containing protein [Gilbertella persicaria]